VALGGERRLLAVNVKTAPAPGRQDDLTSLKRLFLEEIEKPLTIGAHFCFLRMPFAGFAPVPTCLSAAVKLRQFRTVFNQPCQLPTSMTFGRVVCA